MAGGTGIGLLNGGNRASASTGNDYVTKTELAYVQELAKKDSELALLQSEQNTEVKMTDVYKQAHSEIATVRDTVQANYNAQQQWNATQAVNNATMSAAIATNTASIAALNDTLGGITKTIVPISSVCPEPMKLYNSWTAPTTTTTTAS